MTAGEQPGEERVGHNYVSLSYYHLCLIFTFRFTDRGIVKFRLAEYFTRNGCRRVSERPIHERLRARSISSAS
jgi:hypothetical protein